MAVRASMSALITRIRVMINDTLPAGSGQIFDDQTVQDVMDETRQDLGNVALSAVPSFSGPTIQYLDYYSDLGGWENNTVLKQYLTVVVTPSVSEPIVGHWAFAQSTFPPVYITGSLFDVYRSAADLLERWAAKWALNHDFSSDSQSFRTSQVPAMLQALAHTYRLKQRAGVIVAQRSDLAGASAPVPSLAAKPIDYMAQG